MKKPRVSQKQPRNGEAQDIESIKRRLDHVEDTLYELFAAFEAALKQHNAGKTKR